MIRDREFEIYNRNGKCFVRNTNTGTELPMSAFQSKCKFQAEADEIEKNSTLVEMARQACTFSTDVPNSVESRIVLVDRKAAKRIRDCLMSVINDEPKADWNFYTRRMNEAISYVTGRRRFKYGSPEYEELRHFMWMICTNWRSGKSAETIAALGISPDAYRKRIARLQTEFDDPEWAAYLIHAALVYGAKLRMQEERENNEKGGILPPDWL